ncbi:MAG: GtrA family protein, partial [Candidatus Paceibacterales bacterium]
MPKKDIYYSLAAGVITAIFLVPTLRNTNIWAILPMPLVLLFIVFPIVSVVGMYIVSLLSKKIPVLWQVAKFAQVGVLNTAVDFGILNILIGITQITSGTGIIFMNVTSFSTALINSYFWNKTWVFSETKKSTFVAFVIVTVIGLSLNTAIVYGLTTYVPPVIVNSQT